MWLAEYVEEYLLRTDVGEGYAAQLRWLVRGFSKHLTRPARLDDLTSEQINSYLAHLRTEGYAGETRRSRRRMLLTLASDAARLRLIAPVNRDLVVRVKVFPQMPDGLTWTEARHVILCLNGKGKWDKWLSFVYSKTGICRRDWWRAYLQAAWDTGAPADVRELRFEDIHSDGRVFKLRHKTGKPLRWQLAPYTLRAIERIREPQRELVFPLSGHINLFRREARRILCEIAGLQGKSLGGFRSGAGTDAEMVHGQGAGSQLLGNTPAIFVRHYEIAPLIQRPAPSPRPLMDDAGEQNGCEHNSEATGN